MIREPMPPSLAVGPEILSTAYADNVSEQATSHFPVFLGKFETRLSPTLTTAHTRGCIYFAGLVSIPKGPGLMKAVFTTPTTPFGIFDSEGTVLICKPRRLYTGNGAVQTAMRGVTVLPWLLSERYGTADRLVSPRRMRPPDLLPVPSLTRRMSGGEGPRRHSHESEQDIRRRQDGESVV
jgi:hypothetical protein